MAIQSASWPENVADWQTVFNACFEQHFLTGQGWQEI